ncbi:MAG TPA: tRNA (adenosine(37)-N6)-threonylcarbamoyltransferase complex ATPase subunit type 1 TsaE [Blastocatellia bacterium]|nr:tRNA (adenosine(37)-N6)-threonylcarbamoyltransferase complex ATPase subunit type 1 TsaE [Blastocatellia bacterium]
MREKERELTTGISGAPQSSESGHAQFARPAIEPEDRSQLIDQTVSQVMAGPGPSRCGMVTRSPEETFELGRRLAERLSTGAVFLLSGDLGAGKTVFTKGIAAGLGIDPLEITSPTFTLVNVHLGRLPLYHVDLYRLERASTANVGLEDILEDPNNVSVIEWAERLDYPVPTSFSVMLEYVQETDRKISIKRA